MFKNITIKTRLVFIIAFLCVISIVVGIQGILSLNAANASVKTLYEDRVVALGQLSNVLRMVQNNQISIATAINGDTKDFPAASDEVSGRMQRLAGEWARYMATYMTPEEKAIAEKFDESRKRYVEEGLKRALTALRESDGAKANAIFRSAVRPLYVPVQEAMQQLIALQTRVSKDEFAKSQQRYAQSRLVAIALIVTGLVVGAVVGIWLISGIVRSLDQALKLATTVAQGDLTERLQVESNDELGQLLRALGAMNGNLADIVAQVRTGADTIATASSQIATGNLDLSSRTEQQASALEETASSMEELTSTVKQNSENARVANGLAISASDVATQGGRVVADVVATMEEINDSARKIVEIISVIDGIAFQTNILALNAAVEAARAGEQGRGFAVVASEVRNLAHRSAAAAKEIKVLIGNSVERVDAGTRLVGQAGTTMSDIVESIKRVADIMGEISSASREQEAGIEQINQAVVEMDAVTQQNAALVEEAAAAAQSLQEQAVNMVEVVSVFKLATSSESWQGAQHPSTPGPLALQKALHSRTRQAQADKPSAKGTRLAVQTAEWTEF